MNSTLHAVIAGVILFGIASPVYGVDLKTMISDVLQETPSSTLEIQGNSDVNTAANVQSDVEVRAETGEVLVVTSADVKNGAVQAEMIAAGSVSDKHDLSTFVVSHMERDTDMSRVESSSMRVAVTHRADAKLLGFISLKIPVAVTVAASGNLSVAYPWYSFLFITHKDELQARLGTEITPVFAEGRFGVNAEGGRTGNADEKGYSGLNPKAAGSTQTSAQAGFSAKMQAEIIDAVRTAFEQEARASVVTPAR